MEESKSNQQSSEPVAKVNESNAQPNEDEHINVRVVSQHGNEVYFKIKQTTPFKKLMDAYCSRQGQAPSSIRFIYDGNRLQDHETPKSVGMENDEIIDAVVAQTGGGEFYKNQHR